ncbi:MAG: right-handed parallel beta-helix repeat-containing protein, partial [Myxococcota bacterium]|nr:right-handed parallel beta-helix repeat-containing protein [Myxococcota bacterium]
WGDLETDSDTIYVDASAEDGGDGSKDSPFTVIQEGLDAQGRNGMVAVAAGTYVENLYMDSGHSGVHLAGRCMELVVIDGSEGSEENWEEGCGIYMVKTATVGGNWTLSGLTVTQAPQDGIVMGYGSLTLERVSILENQDRGLQSYSGVLETTDCVVQGNYEFGIFVSDSTVTLRGLQVLETQPGADGEFGRGINVQDDSNLVATDCIVQGNHQVGVSITSTNATLSAVQVLDSHPDGNGENGVGINVQVDGNLVATDCTVQGNDGWGLSVASSNMTLNSSLVQENHYIGVFVGTGGSATLDSVQVLDIQPHVDGSGGRGINIQESTLAATACVVQGNQDVAIFVGTGATATLDKVQVLDTRRDVNSTAALGIISQDEASVIATELTVQRTDGPAFHIVGDSMLDCTDCILTDNRFAGAVVQGGGALILQNTLIEGTVSSSSSGAGLGVFVSDWGQYWFDAPSLTILDSTIR